MDIYIYICIYVLKTYYILYIHIFPHHIYMELSFGKMKQDTLCYSCGCVFYCLFNSLSCPVTPMPLCPFKSTDKFATAAQRNAKYIDGYFLVLVHWFCCLEIAWKFLLAPCNRKGPEWVVELKPEFGLSHWQPPGQQVRKSLGGYRDIAGI